MRVLLAPWPFLLGGATAVEVTLRLDGDVVEQRYLSREGKPRDREARDGDGLVRVRGSDDCGFELLIHGVHEGVVTVGARQVSVRELALCGVGAVPLAENTTAWLRLGASELHVAGTTAPRKLALAPRRSARDLATLVAGAAAALVCAWGVVVTMNAPPRKLDWQLRYDAWLDRLTGGHGDDALVKFYEVKPPPRRANDAAPITRDVKRKRVQPAATAKPATSAAKAAATTAATSAAKAAATTAAKAAATSAVEHDDRVGAVAGSKLASGATAGLASASQGAERAHAAGAVGALAQWHAAFLGDEHLAEAVEVALSDRRAIEGAATTGGSRAYDAASGDSGRPSGDSGRPSGVSGVASADSGHASGDSGHAKRNSGNSAGGTASGTNSSDDSDSGGLGLGGGGGDEDTIALGDIGTMGHGSGDGTGSGYGEGHGYSGFGGHHTVACDALVQPAEVRGSCDAELIRRVVRAHVNEVRFCYEAALQSRPELSGRVVTQFHIADDGSATDAAIASSTVADARVGACVAGAVRRWQFPRCAAQVSYPFVFVPGGD